MGSSSSTIKDMGLAVMGNLAAIAPVEVLKNSMANYSFEHFKIASYKALLALAELAGHAEAAAPLQQSLDEELRMAAWCETPLGGVVRRYAAPRRAGETAGV